METWRDIQDFEGIYQVSNFGRVKSMNRWQIIPPTSKLPNGMQRFIKGKIHKGHHRLNPKGKVKVVIVGLRKEGRYHYKSIHELVLSQFIGPRPAGLYGCHIDDNPTNNRLANLYWGTPSQNCADKIRHGNQQRGVEIPWSKLNEEDVRFIREKSGLISQSRLAEMFNVGQPQISRIVNRHEWKHI